MPPAIVNFPAANRATPAHRVYVRANWADEWEPISHLHCDYVQFTANPEIATAAFTWHFGRILHPLATDWTTEQRLDISRQYVKVEIDDPDDDLEEPPSPIVWYGIFEEEVEDRKRLLGHQLSGDRAGVQHLMAYGLDTLLQRHMIRDSLALTPDGGMQTIQRAIEFNARHQFDGADNETAGNRSPDANVDGQYVFAHDLAEAKYWSTLDAASYLLGYQTPKDDSGDRKVPFILSVDALFDVVPDFDKPRKACHGRSTKQVLDELLHRSRLLGYTIQVDEEEDPHLIELRTFTFTPSDIDYDGHEIPANNALKALYFDSDSGVTTATLKQSTLDEVDQVVCLGDRVIACFSLSSLDGVGTLVAHWSEAQKDAYDAGASDADGYGALDPYEQQQLDERARQLRQVERVYSYFGLPQDWNGFVAEGVPYFEDPDNDGQPLPFYWPELRFLSHLPLKTDHDYSDDAISDDDIVDSTPEGQHWEYQSPFVIIKRPDAESYVYLDRVATNLLALDEAGVHLEDGTHWSGSLRMQQDAPGIIIGVNGAPQHVLASGSDFVPLSYGGMFEDAGEFQWQDHLIATVAAELDLFAEGRWPVDLPATDAVRTLTVDLGDEFQQHYVTPHTIVGLDKEGNKIESLGGFIRNDTYKLQALARLTYEWYGVPKQSLTLSTAYITSRLRVGDLVTTIGEGGNEVEINSVVTGVKYEMSIQENATGPGQCRSTFTLQYAEIDAQRFAS